MNSRWCCPLCRSALHTNGRSMGCDKGHSFDVSKEGYINLLPSRGGTHGDNRDMTLARSRFLALGHYRLLAEQVAAAVKAQLHGGVLLDCGCGEGYYTGQISSALDSKCDVYGIDISRDMVRRAARSAGKFEDPHYAVGSVYDLPMADGSADCITDIFSPLAQDEYHRVLRTGGIFVMALPDRGHLMELKRVLYDTPYENKVQSTELGGFELICDTALDYSFELQSQQQIADLFTMTPYYYRTPILGRQRLASLDGLAVTAQFRVLCYRRLL